MNVDRRRFLRGALMVGGAAAFGGGGYVAGLLSQPDPPPPILLWSEEFDGPLDLVGRGNAQGRWRASDVWQPTDVGYADFGAGGHSCWMATPEQTLGGHRYNPFSVAGSVLTITATRTPADALADAGHCPWLGGILISNTDRPDMTFGYGYYEFRARFPDPGRGMFPALWFYAAHGQNPARQEAAEIDVIEVFGQRRGRPWTAGVHVADADGAMRAMQVISSDADTTAWHTYGLHWTPERVAFYRDRALVRVVDGDAAEFFTGCQMSIRMDMSMDATWFDRQDRADTSTPARLRAQIDYVRRYDRPF